MGKKIGVLLDHYSFRADVRDFIDDIVQRENVVIFVSQTDRAVLPYESRSIERRSTFKNRLLDFLFDLIVITNVRRSDVINWRFRRLASKLSAVQYLKVTCIYLIAYFPKFVSADTLINLYDVNKCDLSDVDVFLAFSDVKYPCLLARLKKEGIATSVYIYSWDHPSKLSYVPHEGVKYLVWNEALKDDLLCLHSVPCKNVSIVGSTQLSYLYEFLADIDGKSEGEGQYIYFAAAWGREVMAKQELLMLERLSKFMREFFPDKYILFRPYPNIEDPRIYDLISFLPNIVVDNYQSESTYIFDKENIKDKYEKINAAAAVIHTGSTFGLEVVYFNTPCLIYTFRDDATFDDVGFHMKCSNALKQHHLNKYLVLDNMENVIANFEELYNVISLVFSRSKTLNSYNVEISKFLKLDSLDAVAEKIINEVVAPGVS